MFNNNIVRIEVRMKLRGDGFHFDARMATVIINQ